MNLGSGRDKRERRLTCSVAIIDDGDLDIAFA